MLLSLPSRCWDYKLEPLCPTFYMGSEDPRLGSYAYKASTLLMERSRQPPTSLTVYLPCPITAPKSSLALVLFSELFQALGSSDTEQVDLWLLLVTQNTVQVSVLSASQLFIQFGDWDQSWGMDRWASCHHSPLSGQTGSQRFGESNRGGDASPRACRKILKHLPPFFRPLAVTHFPWPF